MRARAAGRGRAEGGGGVWSSVLAGRWGDAARPLRPAVRSGTATGVQGCGRLHRPVDGVIGVVWLPVPRCVTAAWTRRAVCAALGRHRTPDFPGAPMIRWTGFVIAHRKRIVAAWLVLFVLGGYGAANPGGLLSNRFRVPGLGPREGPEPHQGPRGRPLRRFVHARRARRRLARRPRGRRRRGDPRRALR